MPKSKGKPHETGIISEKQMILRGGGNWWIFGDFSKNVFPLFYRFTILIPKW
jgi:hypothetical protein